MKVPMILAGVLFVVAPFAVNAQGPGVRADRIELHNCSVMTIEDIDVPSEEAGVLQTLSIKEGSLVTEGQIMAQVDATMANLQLEVAKTKLTVATKQAESQTTINYAQAAKAVALAEYWQGKAANDAFAGTTTDAEMRRLELTYRRSEAEVAQAQEDQVIAGLQMQVSEAEVKAAQEAIQRRKIISPMEAQVAELLHWPGEWVQQGEPVMRLIRTSALFVEGELDRKNFAPVEVDGRPVIVTVEFERGRKETFPGTIVFASDEIRISGTYAVRAKVENRKADGRWLLQPGLIGDMVIDLTKPAVR